MNNFDRIYTSCGYVAIGQPVPGIGHILRSFYKDGAVYAARSDGANDVLFQLNDDGGWYVVREVTAAKNFIRELTEGETAFPHPSGNGWIIAHPDRPPMWCRADGDVYRQSFIEPIEAVMR